MMKLFYISALVLLTSFSWSQEEIGVISVFSPNDDGLNDTYAMPTGSYEMVSFVIYNRWGEQLYKGYEVDAVWDGTSGKEDAKMAQASGVYMYVFNYLIDGEKFSMSGNITLMR
ncbi:MAG: gliding motility-associated C-terminal domain-containing protein [Flavobacteriales bacterium]|nr:gliding motility-associated C-terminal domain-containing protein [Flavobacteriales bacterium]